MIVLRFDLLENETPLISRKLLIKVDSFGWNSSLHSGLIFVKPENQKKFNTTVAASWMLSFNPRSKSLLSNIIGSLLFGFHTATLNLSESVHIGIGPSIYLANNLLQGGFGWDLNSENNSNNFYYYIGIGLLDLLKTVSK